MLDRLPAHHLSIKAAYGCSDPMSTRPYLLQTLTYPPTPRKPLF